MSTEDIGEVLLVGGSSSIPWVVKNLKEKFDKAPNDVLRAEEGVAEGAAILADQVSRTYVSRGSPPRPSPPSPSPPRPSRYFCIGLRLAKDKVHPIVKQEVTLPYETSMPFMTHKDNMNTLSFDLVQGESEKASENQSLGKIKIDVPPAPKGQQKVKMTIRIDEEGKIDITLTRKSDGEVFKL